MSNNSNLEQYLKEVWEREQKLAIGAWSILDIPTLLSIIKKQTTALEAISDRCKPSKCSILEVGSLSDYGNNGDDYAKAMSDAMDGVTGDLARTALAEANQIAKEAR